jgi:hypothetical protein
MIFDLYNKVLSSMIHIGVGGLTFSLSGMHYFSNIRVYSKEVLKRFNVHSRDINDRTFKIRYSVFPQKTDPMKKPLVFPAKLVLTLYPPIFQAEIMQEMYQVNSIPYATIFNGTDYRRDYLRRPDHMIFNVQSVAHVAIDPRTRCGSWYERKRNIKPNSPDWCKAELTQFMGLLNAVTIAANASMLLHASCVNVDGYAYVFMGHSGAGKSTIASMMKNARMISDDQVLLRKTGDRVLAFSTPEKVWINNTDSLCAEHIHEGIPVRAIFSLNKSPMTRLRGIKRREVVQELLDNTIGSYHYRFVQTKYAMRMVAERINEIMGEVDFFKLDFEKSRRFEKDFMNLMNKQCVRAIEVSA